MPLRHCSMSKWLNHGFYVVHEPVLFPSNVLCSSRNRGVVRNSVQDFNTNSVIIWTHHGHCCWVSSAASSCGSWDQIIEQILLHKVHICKGALLCDTSCVAEAQLDVQMPVHKLSKDDGASSLSLVVEKSLLGECQRAEKFEPATGSTRDLAEAIWININQFLCSQVLV